MMWQTLYKNLRTHFNIKALSIMR